MHWRLFSKSWQQKNNLVCIPGYFLIDKILCTQKDIWSLQLVLTVTHFHVFDNQPLICRCIVWRLRHAAPSCALSWTVSKASGTRPPPLSRAAILECSSRPNSSWNPTKIRSLILALITSDLNGDCVLPLVSVRVLCDIVMVRLSPVRPIVYESCH